MDPRDLTDLIDLMRDRNASLRPPKGGLGWLGDVASLWSLWTIDDLELDRLAFFERAEARTLNCGEVHEYVVAAFTFNESVTLRVVEPLDLAGDAHTTCLPYENRDGARRITPCRRFRGRDKVQK